MTSAVLILLCGLFLVLWRKAAARASNRRALLIVAEQRAATAEACSREADTCLHLLGRLYLDTRTGDPESVPDCAAAVYGEVELRVINYLHGTGQITDEQLGDLLRTRSEHVEQLHYLERDPEAMPDDLLGARMADWGQPPTQTPIEDLLRLRDLMRDRGTPLYPDNRPAAQGPDDFPDVLHEVPDDRQT